MDKDERRAGLTAAIVTIFLVSLLAGCSYYYWDKSRVLTGQKERISSRADSLLATKLQLEDDIQLLSRQLATATNTTQSLTGKLAGMTGQISQKNGLVRSLRRNNTNRSVDLVALGEEVTQLRAIRDSMSTQLASVRNEVVIMTASNQALASQKQALEKQVTQLTEKVQAMVPRSVLTADSFRIDATKRNNKETAKAKKVHTLNISFTVPTELGLSGTQDVFLSLTDAQNKALPGATRSETINTTGQDQVISVHGLQTVDFGKAPQPVSFVLEPGDRLKPGTYRASAFTRNAYLGTVEFTCRDSFLFF